MSRRKPLAPPSDAITPARRSSHSQQLLTSVSQLEQAVEEKPPAAKEVDQSIAFRVKLDSKTSFDKIERVFDRADIRLVANESQEAVIAYKDDSTLTSLKDAISSFSTPLVRKGVSAKTTVFDALNSIAEDGLVRLTKRDRIGHYLAKSIGDQGDHILLGSHYTVDIHLWNTAHTKLETFERIKGYIGAVTEDQAKVYDSYCGTDLVLIRARVSGSILADLLEFDSICEVELPPRPHFDPVELVSFDVSQCTVVAPPSDAICVCVIDSGVNAAHPLLEPFVAHAESFHTKVETASDVNGHGTAVCSVAVFGDIEAHVRNKHFESDVQVCSARILNENNELDDELLFITQVSEAVSRFKQHPFNCRVFNLSFGASESALPNHCGRQAPWAEQLDEIARREQILFVVSSGNTRLLTSNRQLAEEIYKDYPSYMFTDEAGLSDPATSALAITVGSIAHSDSPQISRVGPNDIAIAVARSGEPSPFSRTGYGVNKAVKPDFVEAGGNLKFDRRISKDNGLSMLLLGLGGGHNLLRTDVGTSFAAPRVARAAARTWRSLSELLRREPSPNLVRAVLGASRRMPALRTAFGDLGSEFSLRSVGYGQPDEALAIASIENDVMLIVEGEIEIDGFQLFHVPIPKCMVHARGQKRVICSLAFDPPVNGKRRDYLACEMDMNLFRGIGPDELVDHYQRVEGDREARKAAPKSVLDRRKCDMLPTVSKVDSSTLQCREFSAKRLSEADGDSYLLMLTSYSNWKTNLDRQRFSLAVRLTADSEELYSQVRANIRQHMRPRVRL